MTKNENEADGPDGLALTRLRTTRTKYESDLKQSGSRAGERFATINADYPQLKRLQRWSSEVGSDGEVPDDFWALAKLVTNEDGSEKDLEKEMRRECGSDIDEPEWIAGFIETALAKFEELEPKL